MTVTLISHNYPNVISTIEMPTQEVIRECIGEILAGNVDVIQLTSENNHLFLSLSESGNRWLIQYSGITDSRFVNAILTDETQTAEKEIRFVSGGQRVDYRLNETVTQVAAVETATQFARAKTLYDSEDTKWRYNDELPL